MPSPKPPSYGVFEVHWLRHKDGVDHHHSRKVMARDAIKAIKGCVGLLTDDDRVLEVKLVLDNVLLEAN